MEKHCIWHFKPEGGGEIGPNDPLHITFKGNPYYSIVREAIQNSLDAVKDKSNPVKVSFQDFELDRLHFPSFFKLEEHIEQSLDYYNSNIDAERLFGDMLKYLNGNESGKKKLKICCLKISDTNTKGMYFDDTTTSPFYAFLRASGVSSKNQAGSGGSFGFGKGAYFALSPLKTVVVSSKDLNGNVFFEGATRLTTHKNSVGEKISAYGFYDNNSGNPTIIEEEIPEIFRRTEPGTDVNIIGLWDETNRKKIMIKSVLNNFWLSIHDNKLVVEIGNIVIDKDNLEQIIDDYFDGQFENGTPSEIESWNPKSYFKAVKYAKSSEQFQLFEGKLNTIGTVKLFVYLEKSLPNRISYFRKPRMVVAKKTNRKINGYSAVFICDNDKGNEMLRLMENPAHNEWNLDNYPKNEGKIDTDARRGYYEINDFINKSLESLSKIKTGKKISFLGLEEYLSIPEDLLEKDEEYDFEGMNANNSFGKQSNEKTEDETGLQTTDKVEEVKIKPTITPRQEVKEIANIDLHESGEENVKVGGSNETDGGNTSSTEEGNTNDIGQIHDGGDNSNKILVEVGFRALAQNEDNGLYHILIINSDRQINNAQLVLLVGSDNDREDGAEIKFSDTGLVKNNIIKSLSLKTGNNKIKIQFADNLKHSIKIKVYELQ